MSQTKVVVQTIIAVLLLTGISSAVLFPINPPPYDIDSHFKLSKVGIRYSSLYRHSFNLDNSGSFLLVGSNIDFGNQEIICWLTANGIASNASQDWSHGEYSTHGLIK